MSEEITRYKVLENGAVYDLEAKRIVSGATLTSEQFSAMSKRRHELARESIAKGVSRGTGGINEAEALEIIMAKRASVAATDNGRAGNDAAKLILQALDALPDKKSESVHVERVEHTIPPETLALLEAVIAKKRGE